MACLTVSLTDLIELAGRDTNDNMLGLDFTSVSIPTSISILLLTHILLQCFLYWDSIGSFFHNEDFGHE